MDWGLGRYERIAEQLHPAAEILVEAAGISAGERVVDVGCGTGNAALLAAERGAIVVGVDPAQIDRIASAKSRLLLAAWIPGGAISRAVRFTRETLAEIRDDPPQSQPFAWHELDSLAGRFAPYGFSASLTEHPIAFRAPSVDEFMQIEGENHPIAIAARPVFETAGRAEEVRDGMRRIYEEANEDPDAFQVTSAFVVAELKR